MKLTRSCIRTCANQITTFVETQLPLCHLTLDRAQALETIVLPTLGRRLPPTNLVRVMLTLASVHGRNDTDSHNKVALVSAPDHSLLLSLLSLLLLLRRRRPF